MADPRTATHPQFIFGFEQICQSEAPILEDRLFSLYARAAGLGRVYSPVRSRLERALDETVENGKLCASKEFFGDHEETVIKLPRQPSVIPRTLGSRSLHEIPGSELAEVMMEIRVSQELIGREELFRFLLAHYGLSRLTKATEKRLDDVLKTWLS